MTHDLSDFEHQLGLELEAAARRRIQSRGSRRRNRALLTATAAIAVLAVAALVLSSLRAQPAAAHPFRIVHLDDDIHLEIVDLVEDPHAAERQLRDELGIDVELVARPAPPELVDQVVGAASTGTTAALVIFDDAGRSERVVLPRRIDGTLTIHYGREARPGEHYHVNITSPACRELWATTPQQAAARLAELADRIRYDTIDADHRHTSDVAPTQIDPHYRLIDIMYLAQNEILVVFSAHLDALGTDRPNCGWPTDQEG